MDDEVRVLHVDDADDPDRVAGFLEDEVGRFEVATATTAGEALERLDEDVDCVVSEYDVPGMDGIELLDAVRDRRQEIPFMMLTGKGSEDVASEAISAGVTDYFRKDGPSSRLTVLAHRIETAVEERRSRRLADEAKEQFIQIAEKSEDALFMFSGDWSELLFVNSAYEDIWGGSVEELETEPSSFLDYIHPEDRDIALQSMQRLSEGEPDEVEYRVIHSDTGEKRWVRGQSKPITDDEGAVTRIVGFVRDITERKERERELEATNRQLQAVVNTVDAAIFIKDTESRYQLMNQECRRLLGVGPDEDVVGLTDHDLLPAEVADKFRADDRRVVENETTLKITEEVPAPDETQINLTIKSPFYGEDGELLGLCAVSSDITDRKEREEQIRRQNERLNEFASVVSHDLRNPLNVAQGRLELARQECDSDHLEGVARAHDRIAVLIDDLLTLAREGREVGDLSRIDLGELVENCWQNVATPEATIRNEAAVTVRGDDSRLTQLLENLYRNAVDHGGDDVTVTVGTLDDGFYVADDGPGIPDTEREQVFEAGYSTDEDGTGFGLSIVRQVAEAHGWQVAVTDSAEGGARFEVTGVELLE